MKTLLEKTRRINRLLQKSAGSQVDFNEMAQLLSKLINADIYVISRKGKILGAALPNDTNQQNLQGAALEDDFYLRLMKLDETTSNMAQGTLKVTRADGEHSFDARLVTIVPVNSDGERLGTIMMARSTEFTGEDLIHAEQAATTLGMEILRAHAGELEEEVRKKSAVQIALGTLSYSEMMAVQDIFDEMEGSEDLLVASEIADRIGITRSVIVNALRKLESAGVIESRSLGMKGTHIKVLNDRLVEELCKLR